METINTLDYGKLNIATSSGFLCDEVINTIEDNDGNVFDIKKTLNNEVVAIKIKG
jgi:hypothetical protein